MESTAGTRMSARRRPLHTCGVSFLEIARKAYTEAQEFSGPLGLVTRKIIRLASFASLLVYVLQYEYLFLAVLSFVDDHIILALERKVEAIFPPSKYVLNMVDKLLQIVETLPAKFDIAVGKFPIIIHQIPFLDWALSCAISCLNFWLSILTHWGSETAKEKEIVVDINCNDNSVEQTVVQEADNSIIDFQNDDSSETKECFSPISATSCSETDTGSPKVMRGTYKDALEKVVKSTYKAALEKGTIESIQNTKESPKQMIQYTVTSQANNPKVDTNESMKEKECIAEEEKEETSAGKEATGEEGDNTPVMEGDPISLPANETPESPSKGDPILALFDSAWHI